MTRPFLILFAIIISSSVFAQQVNVSFKIINDKNEGIPYASVAATKKGDTVHLQNEVADSSGLVKVSLPKGLYIVRITSADYQSLEKGITVSSTQHFFSFKLESSAPLLKGVTVTSKTPLIKQEEDKTVVDPEPLSAASTNAYEILEKTPGLFVDQDGNVYIASTTPAAVYINGREMKMSTADIATMLKNLPPNAVSKIEILRTPSAKYDASGTTGGIINIVLKKGVKLGLTGSVTAGLQQGVYGNQFLSFSLNNNNRKKTSSINLNYSRRNNFDQIVTNRIFAPDSLLSQDGYTGYPGNSYFGSYSLASTWKQNWNMDYNGSLSYNNFDNKTDNVSSIKEISTSDTLSNNLNRVNNKGYTLNVRTNITFTKKIDTIGSQWDNDFSYSYTRNSSDQVYSSVYYIPYLFSNDGGGNSSGDRNYFTARSDLKLKMKRRFVLETGIKTSLLDFKNVAEYFNKEAGTRSEDNNRTNTFHYKENINALYVQGSKTLGKNFLAKAGLRIENTNMDGHQVIPADTSFKIHRTDLFPYVYLSKKIMTYAGYEIRSYLVYRRTITRPGYDQLNPFPRYVDQYLSEIGNRSRRGGGNVEIALKRFARAVGSAGKPVLGFPRGPLPVISTAVFHALLLCRISANNFLFAACIRCAAAVSLSNLASASRSAWVVPDFRWPASPGSCRRISHGVAYHRYTRLCLPFALWITSGTPQGR